MDKTAEAIRAKKKDKPNEIAGGIVYDKTTKDSEIVKLTENVEDTTLRVRSIPMPNLTPITGLMRRRAMERRFLLPDISINIKHQKVQREALSESSHDLEAELQTLLEELKHD
ncbi:MAG: hypothetical protein ACLRZG_00435 [Streptococcus sp.]